MELVQLPATPLSPSERGSAGASAEREYERRKREREARTREVHPRIGGLLLALRDAPVHEIAFREGALHERVVAQALERCAARSEVIVLTIGGCHGGEATSTISRSRARGCS